MPSLLYNLLRCKTKLKKIFLSLPYFPCFVIHFITNIAHQFLLFSENSTDHQIEMQHQQTDEKLYVINIPYITFLRHLPIAEDPEIRRTRKVFFIIVGVFLVSVSVFFSRGRKKSNSKIFQIL